MAKMTLLEMTQDILNDIDGDEVNSIDDTTESQQVAQIIKSTYFALMHYRNWRSNLTLLQLTASGDVSLPTHVMLPDKLSQLEIVNYDCARDEHRRKIYRPVRYIYPEEFLRRQNQFNDTNENIDVIQDPSGIQLMIRNDIPPTVWTSFDDKFLVFDSYDKEVDSTIQSHKIQAMGYMTPEWNQIDEFVPTLPEEEFTLLLEEAKSRAALKIRQVADQKAEQEAGRQRRWLAGHSWRAHKGSRTPDYGRRSRRCRGRGHFGHD